MFRALSLAARPTCDVEIVGELGLPVLASRSCLWRAHLMELPASGRLENRLNGKSDNPGRYLACVSPEQSFLDEGEPDWPSVSLRFGRIGRQLSAGFR